MHHLHHGVQIVASHQSRDTTSFVAGVSHASGASFASAAMSLSSVSVLTNSLRVRRFGRAPAVARV